MVLLRSIHRNNPSHLAISDRTNSMMISSLTAPGGKLVKSKGRRKSRWQYQTSHSSALASVGASSDASNVLRFLLEPLQKEHPPATHDALLDWHLWCRRGPVRRMTEELSVIYSISMMSRLERTTWTTLWRDDRALIGDTVDPACAGSRDANRPLQIRGPSHCSQRREAPQRSDRPAPTGI